MGRGFRVVEAYSRIVRLGEGLSQTGRLSDAAMDRAMAALKVSAEKVRRRKVVKLKAIATQACRAAQNGQEFVERVAAETGLNLQIITPREEAHLSVAGCLNLLDRQAQAALVVDVGGGSTELSWVDLTAGGLDTELGKFWPRSCRSRHGYRSRSAWSPWPSAFRRANARPRAGSGRWSMR